jgi:hypothetical protein
MSLTLKRSIRRPLAFSALAVLLAVALAGVPSVAESGALGKSLAKTVAGRLAKAPAKNPLKGDAAAKAAAERERAALARELRRLDVETIEGIERRYGTHIAPQRLNQARATPGRLLNHEDYQQQLRRAYPELPASRRENVLGNYVEGRVYVDRNQVRVPQVTAHERLHQLADPRFRQEAGNRLEEGVTQHFAGRIYGDLGLKDLPRIYPDEGRVVQMLEARVGEQQLVQAYFRGETDALRRGLDRQLGSGSFDDMVRALQHGDFRRAEALLKYGK